jgi:hypothetical protein
MGPFDIEILVGKPMSIIVFLLIGFCFGYILEAAGFGNSKRLAGQFYFTDLAVLRVMFTIIVSSMLLVFSATTLGLMDYNLIWVSPTYLWPMLVGGILMGLGFIIGGYCPGTSIVSMATFKVDGLFFVLGAASGMFIFAENSLSIAAFHHSGFLGRYTLMDWSGLGAGYVVLAVSIMALLMFVGASWVKYNIVGMREKQPAWVKVMPILMLFIPVLIIAKGQPQWQDLWDKRSTELQPLLDQRLVQVSADELSQLMENDEVNLKIVDVRSEAEYNLFHLEDAILLNSIRKVDLHNESQPPGAVFMLYGNDEKLAEEYWKELSVQHVPNLYFLEGGLNHWLNWHGSEVGKPVSGIKNTGNAGLKWNFDRALGERWPQAKARHSEHSQPATDFIHKVKIKTAARKSGGCG